MKNNIAILETNDIKSVCIKDIVFPKNIKVIENNKRLFEVKCDRIKLKILMEICTPLATGVKSIKKVNYICSFTTKLSRQIIFYNINKKFKDSF
jgi:hypothetical protein